MIAIDLGSNTIRFIEYDGTEWGKSFEQIVRTAEGLGESGRIGEKALQRIVAAIAQAREILDFDHQAVCAYTTAAMRLATNAGEMIERIAEATGIRFRVIDALTEAALTLSAVRNRLERLGIAPGSFLLVDIGGGSTELISCCGPESRSVSLDTGIVTLSERSPTPEALHARIETFKEEVRAAIAAAASVLVLTAGTPTTIAAYVLGMDYASYDPLKVNGYRLRLAECERTHRELLAMEEAQRVRYVGVGRENLIIAGIEMVRAIYEAMGCDEAIIVDDGLREGIALGYFSSTMD